MKKLRVFSLFLIFFVVFSAICTPIGATSTDPAVTNGCHGLDAAMTLSDEEKLVDTAKAAIVYELNSGTMLYTWNPDAKIFPTSMVKIMTTLVALENADPDEMVTVTRAMRQKIPIGIVSMNLTTGEEIPLRDLLYATMVASATDASVVAAMHVGGSIEGFVQMMNVKAAQLGCENTHYSNVHGLHEPETYTTARDICRITEAALQNDTFREMFRCAEYTIAATNNHEERVITTSNNMMRVGNSKYYDARITGGKTGSTKEGGQCLTLTAEQNGMTILCVLMGATPTMASNGSIAKYGSYEESKGLVDYALNNFEFRQVFFEGQSLGQYPVEGGASHVVTQANASISTVLPVQLDESQLKWVYQTENSTITAPVEKGQKLGSVQVWYGTKCLAQTDMNAMHAVEKYHAPIVPEKPAVSRGNWKALLWVMIGFVGIGALAVLSMRTIHVIRYKKRQRRRGRRQ